MFLSAIITSKLGDYYTARPCYQIAFIYHGSEKITTKLYPQCAAYFNGSNHDQHVVIRTGFQNGRPEEISAGLGIGFGMALFLALAIHAVGVEIYVSCSPEHILPVFGTG